MKIIKTLSILICCIALNHNSFSQAGKEGAPVTIELTPAIALPGASVLISGTTLVGKSALELNLSIVDPAGKKESRKVKTDNSGNYKTTFTNTQATGLYKITVTSADDKTSVKDTLFIAKGGDAYANTVASRIVKLQGLTSKALELSTEKVADFPPSAAIDQFKEKVSKCKAKLNELKTQNEKVREALGSLLTAYGQLPKPVEPLNKHIAKIDEWVNNMDSEIPGLEQMLNASRDKATKCDNLNSLAELFGFISLCLDFQGKFLAVCLNLASDKALPGAIDRMNWGNSDASIIESKKLAINESQKTMVAAVQSASTMKDFITKGFTLDIGQFVTKILYQQICAELKGPVTTTFRAEFLSDNGALYWTYDVTLTGLFTLRYDKSGDFKKAVAVTGEFEGFTTGYKFWEDIEQVEKPKGGMMLLKKIRKSPIPINANAIGNDLGMFARNMVPGSHKVKVSGEIIKNKLTLKIDNSVWDALQKEEQNKLAVILVAPVVPIPFIKQFDFPIARPKVIYYRGFDGKQEFEVKTSGSNSSVQKNINTTTNIPGGVKLVTKIAIDIKS